MSRVFFSDLKSGRCSSAVEVRLLRFWEARNPRRGGELMWIDLLMVDVVAPPTLFCNSRDIMSLTAVLRGVATWKVRSIEEALNIASVIPVDK
ncbi:unnamed protein product [Eruca vesicaria subsp. sativa]|uniref:Uncharacterized protein n=1 Tax=Eruca vesicaria subsp. sativa TaxID=29727 RepID=A0ABC8L7R1_ERUVS|nr:unnamed protein product [Eruca vesicaria subsp. sativa]